jgi:hypothetical protein
MIYFFAGTCLAILGVLASVVMLGIEKAYFITGGIGFFLLGISMILSGSLVSGDKIRANFATESDEDRNRNKKIMFRTAQIGMPNLVLALLIYLLLK